MVAVALVGSCCAADTTNHGPVSEPVTRQRSGLRIPDLPTHLDIGSPATFTNPIPDLRIPNLPTHLDGFEAAKYLSQIAPTDAKKSIAPLSDKERVSLKFIVIQVAAIAESVNHKDELLPTDAFVWKVMVMNYPELAPGGVPLVSVVRGNAVSVVNLGRALAGRPPTVMEPALPSTK